MLDKFTTWEIGDGKSIRVWDDCWVEIGLKLREVFPHNVPVMPSKLCFWVCLKELFWPIVVALVKWNSRSVVWKLLEL